MVEKLLIRDLHKTFGDLKVLRGVEASFEAGQIHGLLGRNGAGKTTFFSLIYGDIPLDRGHICLVEDGVERPLQSTDVGMLFAEPILPPFLTAYEYLSFIQDLNGGRDESALRQLLDHFEFSETDTHRLIADYSSGMQAKLSIMGLLIFNPSILLLDEPLTSLDLIVAAQVKSILRDFVKDRIVILSTHITSLAQELCDDITLLRNGQFEKVSLSDDFDAELIRLLEDEHA